jgi:peptidoglycan/LPS O-acetylase OafA/YrhL
MWGGDADPGDIVNRMPMIDVLRLVAALSVWFFHACFLNASGPLPGIAEYGYLGVPVFFMVSGFVISVSAHGRNRMEFARARAVRLYPAFLLALIPTTIALLYLGRNITLAQFAANLTMVPRILKQPEMDGVMWSLMFEILFYGYVWAFLVGPRFVPRLRTFCMIWLALSSVNMLHQLPLRVLLILDWGPYFTVGCFAWLWLRSGERLDRTLWLLSCGIATALAMKQTASNPFVAAPLVAAFALALPAITRMRLRSSLQGWALLAGAMSYPLYLIHHEFGNWVTANVGLAASAVVVLVVTYAITRAEGVMRRALGRSRRGITLPESA